MADKRAKKSTYLFKVNFALAYRADNPFESYRFLLSALNDAFQLKDVSGSKQIINFIGLIKKKVTINGVSNNIPELKKEIEKEFAHLKGQDLFDLCGSQLSAYHGAIISKLESI